MNAADKTGAEEDALAEAYERALALEKAGDGAAAAAWAEVLALDAADPGGAALRLAALRAGPLPDRAPAAYVATLFDQHAEVFDGILVDQLEYGAPLLARERVQAKGLGPFGRMLDLGCGTGLAAEAFEDMTGARTGVDLAPGMIEIADEKELYDELFVGDAVGFLEAARGAWDLIVATDTLPYLGDVAPLFRGVAAQAAPGALFVFSTETLPEAAIAGKGWVVTPHQRFAHPRGALETLLTTLGFQVLEATSIMVRRESGAPIDGHLFLARAPG
ncbi:methyltransferase domain-containing protein [Pikeienuella piscinae]|uniref:Methyltransferase domain-containing protein n=1 Tax=Pikeienuella piscinae TaxID=2748098 RepID=A0A7M3T5F1_9RHOB|nr:methyltransferase domain-containing protein [Pikeienuella piscinae]QIE57232.1 methyltransferase domain-containing protein [Pikeienuella piscinae]